MNKMNRILHEIGEDPLRSASEIADASNCTPTYVRAVASRAGLSIGRPGNVGPQPFGLSSENLEWLKTEAQQAGVKIAQMLNAVVTDARVEQETSE